MGPGTLTLTGANTYTGTTTVSAGVLNIQNASALGTTAAGTTVSQRRRPANPRRHHHAGRGPEPQRHGRLQRRRARNISGNNTYAGAVTLGSAARINSDSGTLTLSGNIGGAYALTVGGAGNTTISSVIGTGAAR